MTGSNTRSSELIIATLFIAAPACLLEARGQAPEPGQADPSQNAAAELPKFEVVSVKTHPPSYWPTFDDFRFTPDGFICRNYTAQDLLVYAYDLRDPKLSTRQRLIPGGKEWMFWDWFDIQARLSDTNIAEMGKLHGEDLESYKRKLVQSVLIDRFGLSVHHVTREAQAWELLLANGGPTNMTPARDDEEPRPFPTDFNHIRWQGAPVSMLVDLLQDLENAPVVDKTGLTGRFDFKLEFARNFDMRLPEGMSLPDGNDSEPPIFTALQKQLGLKLIPAKMSLDEIAIDHIEKPSPN
jgi:uncharacterized protein (TIGR03435 family)